MPVHTRRFETPGAVMDLMEPVVTPAQAIDGVDWYGYEEWSSAPVCRSEPAGTRIVLILEAGEPLSIGEGNGMTSFRGGFVAGLDDKPTHTRHGGHQAGIQVNLSPLAAIRWFGLPLGELAHRVVAVRDVVPPTIAEVQRRLADPHLGWPEKLSFAAVSFPPDGHTRLHGEAELEWILGSIHRSAGDVNIEALARHLGWSPKRLQRTFATWIGLSPKRYARIVRFEALRSLLQSQPRLPWADAADLLGYYDQPHLYRDVREFSGLTPTELARSLRPAG